MRLYRPGDGFLLAGAVSEAAGLPLSAYALAENSAPAAASAGVLIGFGLAALLISAGQRFRTDWKADRDAMIREPLEFLKADAADAAPLRSEYGRDRPTP